MSLSTGRVCCMTAFTRVGQTRGEETVRGGLRKAAKTGVSKKRKRKETLTIIHTRLAWSDVYRPS